MKLTLELKPTRVVANSREDLTAKMLNGYFIFTMTSGYAGYVNSNTNVVRVFNIEKHRPKYKQKRNAHGQYDKESVLVKEKQWVGHYYDIPLRAIDVMKLKVTQYNSRFDILKQGQKRIGTKMDQH